MRKRGRSESMERTVLVTVHAAADLDALGVLALARAMLGSQRAVYLWPGSPCHRTEQLAGEQSWLQTTVLPEHGPFDVLIVLDTAKRGRLEHVPQPWPDRIVVVDHHPCDPDDIVASDSAVITRVPWGACSSVLTAIATLRDGRGLLDGPHSEAELLAALQQCTQLPATVDEETALLGLLGVHDDTGSLAQSNAQAADYLAGALLRERAGSGAAVAALIRRGRARGLSGVALELAGRLGREAERLELAAGGWMGLTVMNVEEA